MPKLTPADVQRFAQRPGVRPYIVENVLLSLGGWGYFAARHMVEYSSECYKWGHETERAIKDGLRVYFDRPSTATTPCLQIAVVIPPPPPSSKRRSAVARPVTPSKPKPTRKPAKLKALPMTSTIPV